MDVGVWFMAIGWLVVFGGLAIGVTGMAKEDAREFKAQVTVISTTTFCEWSPWGCTDQDNYWD